MKSTEPAKVISTIIRKPAGVESTLQATDDSAGNYESDAETQSRNRVCVMNAAEWNSHLIWARRERGPQFDMNTQMFQFDRDSPEYYTQCSDPSLGAVKNLLNQNEEKKKSSENEDRGGRRRRY